MKDIYKVAIIGGGAGGLAAAIRCASRFGGKNVIILEKQNRTGRKLLATGNGRCNISNTDMDMVHYHGDKRIISSVIGRFSVKSIRKFCSEIGLLLREDEAGRIYPYSNQAATVLDCMRTQLSVLGTEEKCDFFTKKIKKTGFGYEISSPENVIKAENIIMASGSKASPALGSDDSGLMLLRENGIKHTPLFPALSPVETKEKYKSLKGIRAKGIAEIVADGYTVKKEKGEIQFSDKALSGICVFQCSRIVNEYLYYGTVLGNKTRKIEIAIDLMPDYSAAELERYLRSCKKRFSDKPAGMILSGALHKRLSEAIVESQTIYKKNCIELEEKEIQQIACAVKCFTFTPVKSDQFSNAQVCAGGIGSDEINTDTMMLKKLPNIYVCGEILNVDGDCGGYNLHFAIGSGIIASDNIK